MSNILDDYRVKVTEIVDKGIQQVEFDPSKVKRLEDKEYIVLYDGEYQITYMYEDEALAKMMYDLNYSLNWNDDLPFDNAQQQKYRENRTGIRLKRYSHVKLRKKRNTSGFTDKSLEEYKNSVERLKARYNVDAVTNMYRRLVEDFNAFYRDEQIKKVSKAYGNVYNWKVEEYGEYRKLDEEILRLEEQLTDLRNKRFDKRCDIVVRCIEKKVESISSDFVPSIMDEVQRHKDEGYKSPFFR